MSNKKETKKVTKAPSEVIQLGTKKVLFTKSPTGKFNLAYSENEVGELESKLADELIESKYAVEVKDKD